MSNSDPSFEVSDVGKRTTDRRQQHLVQSKLRKIQATNLYPNNYFNESIINLCSSIRSGMKPTLTTTIDLSYTKQLTASAAAAAIVVHLEEQNNKRGGRSSSRI
jgi:hypothetical protein